MIIMNIKELCSIQNTTKLLHLGTSLASLIKKNKVFAVSEYSKTYRINGSEELFSLYRGLFEANHYYKVKCENSDALMEIRNIVSEMFDCLNNTWKNCAITINKHTKGEVVQKTIYRNCVSKLEMEYILGNIDREFINNIYHVLGKIIPKKYTKHDYEMKGKLLIVFENLKIQLSDNSADIKSRTIEHYETMVNRIDPTNIFNTPKEFYDVGTLKISDMMTLRMAMACKFNNEKFLNLIDDDFDNVICATASRMIEHIGDDACICVRDVSVGGKGFDVNYKVDSQRFYARAIPVEGSYVRFHYRYIIT